MVSKWDADFSVEPLVPNRNRPDTPQNMVTWFRAGAKDANEFIELDSSKAHRTPSGHCSSSLDEEVLEPEEPSVSWCFF